VCAGLSARENRYFDIKWRAFLIFGPTQHFKRPLRVSD
jgi:hypothetical protein